VDIYHTSCDLTLEHQDSKHDGVQKVDVKHRGNNPSAAKGKSAEKVENLSIL
jgi:hypothetical protein